MEQYDFEKLRNFYERLRNQITEHRQIQKYDVVQLNEKVDPMFVGCFMTVTDIKDWGVQGYVQIPGESAGQAYYRAKTGTFDWVGSTDFIVASEYENEAEVKDEN
jgi:hypothetical protein